MLSIHHRPARLCDGLSRRELLRVGGLSLLGLSLPQVLQARAEPARALGGTFGRAKSVIFLYLAGGPPQHETFDPKPEAPAEIRGPFRPIRTTVPGMHFCELLPRIARMAHRLAVVRSISTNDDLHDSSGAWVLTGHKYAGRNARVIQPTDTPYFGSLVKRFRPSEKLPALSAVWLPDLMRLNENVTPAGQTGGFMGREWDPERFVGDPNAPEYRVEGFHMADLPPLRLERRRTLLEQVERHFEAHAGGDQPGLYGKYRRQAFDLLTSGRARDAFAIHKEPGAVRERYGRNRWGQCVLLARRLVEAGVRLVHVQWPREPGDNAVDNPLWDTHAQNAERMEDVLAPQFDVGFTALIEDLDQRGLLDETLVVAIGEFGRTPKINGNGGRDHWGHVFSFALAGAGIAGGQVFGSSDKDGAYPKDDRVEPGDLTATIFHLLGMDPEGTYLDREGRLQHFTRGRPIAKLLGTEPATRERIEPTGDVRRVPPFDESAWLVAPDFRPPVPLKPATEPSRPRGWRAQPIREDGFGVRPAGEEMALGVREGAKVGKGEQALLAQEVRSPFAGRFKVTVEARGAGSSREFYEGVFLKGFTCKVMFFQYTANPKTPLARRELASAEVRPGFGEGKYESFELVKDFINPNPGQNFSFGLGMGVAVVVERTGERELEVPAGEWAEVRLGRVVVEFDGKPRNDEVTV